MKALKKWRLEVGISEATAWRWRRDGWLETKNICGRPYITTAAEQEFERRAAAGEFAKEHTVPRRRKS